MNAPEVLEAVQIAGGSLTLIGERIQYALPDSAVWLVPELKQNREELVGLLREGGTPPLMPPGVRLLKWEPKIPPVAIVRMGIVSNVDKFIDATLRQLRARLEGKDFLAGNWSLRELVDRLEQVGVHVQVEHDEKRCHGTAVIHE
jgi:hypothetical protein